MASATEQLQTAHHLALRAQHTSRFNGAELVRAWPTVARSAWSLHRMLAVDGQDQDQVVERIGLAADSLVRALPTLSWPGPGKADASLDQVTAALEAARSKTATTPGAAIDSVEARRLLASILWTTSQIVRRATREQHFDLSMRRPTTPSTLTAADIALNISHRFNIIEQLAASALNEQHLGPGVPDGKPPTLRSAVAVWDIEAHRALAADPSTTVLHVLAHLQATSVASYEVLVERAAKAGVINPLTAARIAPILHDTSASWGRLRDTVTDLSFASIRTPPQFINAAKVMNDSLAETFLSGKVEHADVLAAVSGHLLSSATTSAAAQDALRLGDMRAPARAVNRILIDQAGPHSPTSAPVSPVAISRGMSIPITPEIRDLIAEPLERVFHNSHEAIQRAADLDALRRRQPQTAGRPPSNGTLRPVQGPSPGHHDTPPSGPSR